MDKKTVISLIIVLLGVFLLISLAEWGIKAIHKRSSQQIASYIEPTISETQKTIEDRFVTETNDVLTLFQKREYDKIYAKLESTYREAKYPTYEEFLKEMNEKIGEPTKIEIGEMIHHSRGYYAKLLLDNEKEIPLTVNNLASGDLTIMLDYIYQIEDINRWAGTENLAIKFLYLFKYIDKVGYLVEIENESSKPMTFSTFSTYLYSKSKLNREQYDLTKEVITTLDAKEKKRYEMQFPVPSGEMFQPNIMNLHFVVDGKMYSTILSFGAEDEYSDD